MSDRIQAAAVLWNEDPDKLVFFLEELCLEMRESKIALPVLVDCRKTLVPPQFLLRDSKEPVVRGLKAISQGMVPFIHPRDFGLLKKGSSLPEQFLYLLLIDESSITKVTELLDDILFIATPGSESVSLIFRCMQQYRYTPGRTPRFHVIIANEGKIEVAAAHFASLRDEVVKNSKNRLDMLFTGSYALDFEKLNIARSAKVPYRDLFKGDAFYGQLLYDGRKIFTHVEKVETDAGIDSFFASLDT